MLVLLIGQWHLRDHPEGKLIKIFPKPIACHPWSCLSAQGGPAYKESHQPLVSGHWPTHEPPGWEECIQRPETRMCATFKNKHIMKDVSAAAYLCPSSCGFPISHMGKYTFWMSCATTSQMLLGGHWGEASPANWAPSLRMRTRNAPPSVLVDATMTFTYILQTGDPLIGTFACHGA